MMYVAVIPESAIISTQLSQMRVWLDAHRSEPSLFKKAADGTRMAFHVGFQIEDEAISFAEHFGGRLLHPPIHGS